MKPVIGLIPLYDDEKESYWMLPGYMKALEEAGAFPIMLPLTTDKEELEKGLELVDGILFTGGHDVDPSEYKEAKSPECGISCADRDEMEGYLLDRCLEENIPLLGICRGIQFINAHLGGSLYQDLETEYECKVEHHMVPPYDVAAHKVHIIKDTLLEEIIGAEEIEVNSYHHQAIKRLSDKVTKMAVSEDGLVEAIAVNNQNFALAIQWHPEFSYKVNEDSRKLIRAFVNACK